MSRDIPADPDAATLARAVSEVLEPTFSRLARVAAAVAASRPGDGAVWSECHLGGVVDQVDVAIAEDTLAVGMGFAAAPGAVEGRDRFMAWRQRLGERVMRLQLNFDPTSVDVYDYLQMEWFQLAEQGRERVAFGPYVDYSGAGLYVVTLTIPVLIDGAFVGVVGADLIAHELEKRLVGVLQTCPLDAVVISAERRVIAANTPRWVAGARLRALPDVGVPAERSEFVDVAALPVGTGWTLALSEKESGGTD